MTAYRQISREGFFLSTFSIMDEDVAAAKSLASFPSPGSDVRQKRPPRSLQGFTELRVVEAGHKNLKADHKMSWRKSK